MNNFTYSVKSCLFAICLLLGNLVFAQVNIDTENFNSGMGIWNDPGNNCELRNDNRPNTTQSLRLRNSTSTSNTYTNDLNLTAYSSVDFSFEYESTGVEIGESFQLQFSNNSGGSWATVRTYLRGIDFVNDVDYFPTENLANATYTFTANCQFRLIINNANHDNDRIYIDNISIDGYSPGPEINLQGNATNITDGDMTPSATDDTDFGSLGAGSTLDHTFTIQNTGTTTLNLTGAPLVSISGDPAFTVLTQPAGATIATSGSRTFVIRFAPTLNGTVQATVSINSDDSDENPYTFVVQGTGVAPLTQGPGGVTADLELWLKSTDGLSYTDGQSVSLWLDQGRGANATVNTAGQEPTYRDNATHNVNFNPVVEFDNAYGSYVLDSDYSFDNTSTQFLEGTSGLYTQDIFVVLIPDDTVISNNFGFMDIFCGDEDFSSNQTDATGIGAGYYTARFSGEIFCYAVGTTNSGDGYGVAEIGTGSTYDNVGIINARNNTAVTQQELYYNANNIGNTQNDLPDFSNVNDSRYWIGRSEGWEASTNARIAEIITYSARKNDTDLTQDRNKIQSYLAVKYGITLGVNGTSQDYVDSDGTVIWDQSNNSGYNYDIAGIGRDDDSDLLQKQSSSVNNATDGGGPTEGILTIGLTDIYATNNQNITNNANTFNDKEFLMWGNNGIDLNLAAATVNVDMSDGISGLSTMVSFTAMQRIWKVVENGGDIGNVKVSIPQNAVRNISPPGNYLMFISNTPIFDPTADYRVMTLNGSDLEAEYDFNGTKYITFGYAPQVVAERSVYFDGAVDYVDMGDYFDLNPTAFTMSAWIKRDTGTINASIASKRDAANTEGYDFRINNSGRLEFDFNGGAATITSSIVIPENEWHQVAIIYNGGNATLYIDGVADTNASSLPAPLNTSRSFLLAAADGYDANTTDFFAGNIDEVRIWDTALSEDQMRYIMNQEIIDNGTLSLIRGDVVPVSITKNELNSLPWANLAGYYPMTIYTYTNTNDLSGNNIQGALRNLDTVDFQTAPLPYESQANGAWTTDATWLNHNVQTLPNALSIVDGTTPINWNIVETNHDISIQDNATLGREREVLALLVKSNEVTVNGNTGSGTGNGLTVTHYLELDGSIDLEGESQLIQSEGSDLDVTSAGTLERDQQGTADLFTYNYWAAPVGVSNTISNNNSYTLPNVMRDGTNPAAPVAITWLGSGYDGSSGPPIQIADYWVWKFANQLSDNYPSWQHVRSTGSLQAGEGFTMKGITDTGGVITTLQNYVFTGKPHNADITLTLSAGNDYLIGNPYASAIDANEFILDNINSSGGRAASDIINGTLYFWDHFASSTHILAEYQGGYAARNLLGGTVAISNDVRINNTGALGTKVPGRYIPVGQGFYVTATTGGTITFKNSQRTFRMESSGNSQFMRAVKKSKTTQRIQDTEVDNRQKIKLLFDSPAGYVRQLLVGVDPNTTDGPDVGYDALLFDDNKEDMYWLIDNDKYIIQGISDFNDTRVLPLGVKVDEEGVATFKIDVLENIPENTIIYLHDKLLDINTDLKETSYEVTLEPGEYLDRFEIAFKTIVIEPIIETSNLDVHFINTSNTILIENPFNEVIESVNMFNLIGQHILTNDTVFDATTIELPLSQKLSTGTYIIKVVTNKGDTTVKKVSVE